MYYPYNAHYPYQSNPSPNPNTQQITRPAREPSQPNTITVRGMSSVSIQPDMASVQLAVLTENISLTQAQEENAETMNQVLVAIEAQGIPQEKIQTSRYTIQPKYDFVEGKQVFRGYEVQNEITLKITEIQETGQIIDAAVDAGVNRVMNIQFTTQNENAYYNQALQQAIINAMEKAMTIADTLQINLHETPVKLVEKVTRDQVTPRVLAASTQDSFSTPIKPGQIQIQAEIDAIFKY
ncbi:SIMPL domain-containing protein [Oceanobacillus halophilus]|nr:SIMPL domain-containing protein [Oceanobacillus halophilus]